MGAPLLSFDPEGRTGLLLDEARGVYVTEVDLGYPPPRVIEAGRVEHNGVEDSTQFFSARVVSMNMTVTNTRPFLDALGIYMDPGSRPYLFLDDPCTAGTIRRRVALRADAHSSPSRAGPGEFQCSWSAPEGTIESATEHRRWLTPAAEQAGRWYPWTPPRVYPAAGGGDIDIINAGNVAAEWVCRIYGPITNPRLINATDDFRVGLRVNLAAGRMVEVSSLHRTILEDGEPTATRYSWFDFPNSTWWHLHPGASRVFLLGDTWQTPASAELVWRDTYLL
jgi:hypothetical protein